MSYLIKKVTLDIKTGKRIAVKETIVESVEGNFNKGEDILVRIFAESCLKEFQEKQKRQARA